jgi:hypothetical protein
MKTLLVLLLCASALVGAQAPQGLRVIIIDGDEAANIVAERIAAEPVVEVREDDDRRVAGAVVRFLIRRTARNRIAALFSNGQSETTALTDANGRAQSAAITPLEPGSYQIDVQVSHQGRTASTTIRHTNYVTRADVQSAGQTAASSPGAAAGAAGATGAAAAAGGGLSKLAVIGIVAGGAAGAGAAVVLARRESDVTLVELRLDGPETLRIGETAQFAATGVSADGATATAAPSWTSSAPEVAEVSSSGQVTAWTAGSTTISASVEGVSATSTLVVTNPLVGRWVLSATTLAPDGPSIGRRTKAFTDSAWVVEESAPNGQLVLRHGGRYTLRGTAYSEMVDFANPSPPALIGRTFTGTLTVANGTYTQVLVGIQEQWTRVQ